MTSGCLSMQIIFVSLARCFLSPYPATCRGWCYPLRRVCLCGHVIGCKLEQQTAKWVQLRCCGAFVAGSTAKAHTYSAAPLYLSWQRFCEIMILAPLGVTCQDVLQRMDVSFVEELFRLWCLAFHQQHYHCRMFPRAWRQRLSKYVLREESMKAPSSRCKTKQ